MELSGATPALRRRWRDRLDALTLLDVERVLVTHREPVLRHGEVSDLSTPLTLADG